MRMPRPQSRAPQRDALAASTHQAGWFVTVTTFAQELASAEVRPVASLFLLLPDCVLDLETAESHWTLWRRRERTYTWSSASAAAFAPRQLQYNHRLMECKEKLQFCSVFHSTRAWASATAARPSTRQRT